MMGERGIWFKKTLFNPAIQVPLIIAHPDELRFSALIENTWSLDSLLDEVIRSQLERKLIDTALSIGREEKWDFQPRALRQNINYVRRGDAFPTVERRGYLHYSDDT